MKRSHVGFAAFASGLLADFNGDAAGSNASKWADYLHRLVAVGADHVQFLAPDSVEDAAVLGSIAKKEGVKEVSVFYCTFHPACPCADADAAFGAFTNAFEAAQALMEPFTGMPVKRIFSPSLLRGLMDPNTGCGDADDREKQMAFMRRLLAFLKQGNRGQGFELVAEPLNRFETRGPNTVAGAVEIIQDAHANQYFKVGVDSCHSFMECGGDVARLWEEYAPHIGLIHASALGRGHFYEDSRWMEPLFQAVGRNKALRDVPIVVEAFCAETNPAFFPVFGIHEVSWCSAAEMASGTLNCLHSWMR